VRKLCRMARSIKNRRIQMAPGIGGFKPHGMQHRKGPDVFIGFEEYEALKLCDYEMLTQAEAAQMMQISRPTFTRIYEKVRQKIARAFVEGSAIYFTGGHVKMAGWYHCSRCQITFTPEMEAAPVCPFCSSSLVQKFS